ncbi:hypothetical protein DINM_002105 [Dirofilaria immitis]|nr:hypothetical protein [Dirofilaria immitis]
MNRSETSIFSSILPIPQWTSASFQCPLFRMSNNGYSTRLFSKYKGRAENAKKREKSLPYFGDSSLIVYAAASDASLFFYTSLLVSHQVYSIIGGREKSLQIHLKNGIELKMRNKQDEEMIMMTMMMASREGYAKKLETQPPNKVNEWRRNEEKKKGPTNQQPQNMR